MNFTGGERPSGGSPVGSWLTGVDGALPGIQMWNKPLPGVTYRQEYYPNEAEDMASVIRIGIDDDFQTPYATFNATDILETKEWNPLQIDDIQNATNNFELKLYARGIGLIGEFDGEAEVLLADYYLAENDNNNASSSS